ncbi:MAG: hypothetical protein HOI06_06550 [Pelagibacteraceae bacterium]|jgi:hypothetical protein|nr:hypothetical protein [Pelagibacteraceae bacterium]
MKTLLILLLLVPTLAMSKVYIKEGKTTLKTKKSGFKYHMNFMGHHDHNFQYIKDKKKARAGKYYQRFELRDGDCFGDDDGGWSDCDTDRERVEFSTRPRQPITKNQCYGYSLMLSKDFIDTHPTNVTLGQVHQHGGPKGTAEGLASFPPLIQIDAREGSLYFNWHELSGSATNVIDKSRYHKLKSLEDMKGVWTDISFCLDFKNKRMDAWVDGIKKVEILKSPIFFKPEAIYFKHGIYRSFISKYKARNNGKMPTQIVFYDEIRRGNSIEKVDVNINPKLKRVD